MQPADPNTPPLKFRKLRIAWSVCIGVACLLLIVFSFRYWGPHHARILLSWVFLLTGAGITAIFLLKRQQWRFSLRTLIIAITLIAVVLGLAVYAASK